MKPLKTWVLELKISDRYLVQYLVTIPGNNTWYSQAVTLAAKIDIAECMPRPAGRQNNRDNHPASDASEYFKRVITIPILDHLNSDLKTRFEFNSVNAYNGLPTMVNAYNGLLMSTI